MEGDILETAARFYLVFLDRGQQSAEFRRPPRGVLAVGGRVKSQASKLSILVARSVRIVNAALPSVRFLRPATASGAYAICQPEEIRWTAAVAEVRRSFPGFVTRPQSRPGE